MRKEKRFMAMLMGVIVLFAALTPQMSVLGKANKTVRKNISLVAGETVTRSVSRDIKSIRSKKRSVATVRIVASNKYQITAKSAGYATIIVKYGKKTLNLLVKVNSASTVFDGGNGTKQSPYQVRTLNQLQEASQYSSSYFVQTADIDANYGAFEPLFSEGKPFTGVYDGGHYKIVNYCNTNPNGYGISIFGWIGNKGTVKNVIIDNSYLTVKSGAVLAIKNEGNILDCEMTNATVSLKYGTAAVLCASNTGKIKRCVVEGKMDYYEKRGTVQGSNEQSVGGIVGYNYGEICNSTSKCDIKAENYDGYINVGGIVGHNEGMIMECQSDCTIEADAYWSRGTKKGKIAGVNDGNIVRCHSEGDGKLVGDGSGQVIEN